MTVETLARFQFAMTTIFHFFFVPFTIGTCFVVAIMETCYVVTKNEEYKKMTKFWGNIMLLSFAVGVVTGIIQEFQFGMNWSDYSRFVGDIFGAPLAIEALLAFFMESTFLGLWIFTWDNKKISKKMHASFIWLVVFGSLMSAMWILIANAFMQHPVGYEVINGRAQMTDFFALIKNHQFLYEFSHVITGAITMGGTVIAGMAAFRLLKKDSLSESTQKIYQKSLRLGLLVTLIGSISVMGAGDLQMKALLNDQPMKFAAMEGDYEDSGDPAAWTVVAWANEAKKEQVFGIKVPYMLSILSYGKPSGAVKGMETANKELVAKYGEDNYYPMVNLLFYGFRTMAAFGTLMLGVSTIGLFLTRKKNPILFRQKWMLWIVALTTVAPFLSNTFGWIITEQGRYPWTVYGLFKIKDSVSPNVSVTSLFVSNTVYFLLFSGLGAMMVYLTIRELKKGPEFEEEQLLLMKNAVVDPFEKGAY